MLRGKKEVSVFQFVIAALACYRVSVLLVKDAGPWEVFKKARKLTRVSKLLNCMFCTSVWVGAMIEAALYSSGVKDLPIVCVCLALGMSAVTIILDRCFSADYQA